MKQKKKNNRVNPYSREEVLNSKPENTFDGFDDNYNGKRKETFRIKPQNTRKKKLTREQEDMLRNENWLAEHKAILLTEMEQETFEDDRNFLLDRQDYLLKENKRLNVAQKEMSDILDEFNKIVEEKCGEPFEETYDLAWKKDNYSKKLAEFEKSKGDQVAKKLSTNNSFRGNEALKKHNEFLFKLNAFERTWVELARMTCEEQANAVKIAGFQKESKEMFEKLKNLREKQINRENPRFTNTEIEQ